MKKLHAVMLVLGLGFVTYLICGIGIGELWNELMTLGWGLFLLVAAEGLAEMFHAISWRYCLSDPYRSLSLLRLFRISMAGYAFSYVTPAASLGGDVAKAGLLALSHKAPEAVTGALIGKLSFALAHLFVVVLGAVVLLPQIPLPPAVRTSLLASSTLLALGIIAFLWLQKRGKLGALIRWLMARNIGRTFLQRMIPQINQVDQSLKAFYRERPWDLSLAVFWHLLGYSVGIFQIWYFLHLLATPPPFTLAAEAWFVGMWFDLAAFAIPMSLGVLEGGRVLTFSVVTSQPLLGMTYAVALRMTQLFWAAFGLASYALLISPRCGLLKRWFLWSRYNAPASYVGVAAVRAGGAASCPPSGVWTFLNRLCRSLCRLLCRGCPAACFLMRNCK